MKKKMFTGLCTLSIAGMLAASSIPAHAAENAHKLQARSNNVSTERISIDSNMDIDDILERLESMDIDFNWQSLNASFSCGIVQIIQNCKPDNGGNGSDDSQPDNGGNGSDDSQPDNGGNGSDNSQPDNDDNGSDNSQPDNGGNGSDNSQPDNGGNGNDNSEDNSSTDSELSALAAEVADIVNSERANAGLPALEFDLVLSSAAQVRAEEIVTYFSHTRPDGSSFSSVLAEHGISYRGAGENIAWGQRSPSEVMTGWMNSDGHRANILNRSYTKLGVGVYQDMNGRLYWTQLFTY